MFLAEEAVQYPLPIPDIVFTPQELEELLSYLEPNKPVSANSGSDGSEDERKQRRKMSNRESARRSRWRKKRHLEKMIEEVKRLNLENHQLKNRLGLVRNDCLVVWRENEWLRSEYIALYAKLLDLYCSLAAMQSP